MVVVGRSRAASWCVCIRVSTVCFLSRRSVFRHDISVKFLYRRVPDTLLSTYELKAQPSLFRLYRVLKSRSSKGCTTGVKRCRFSSQNSVLSDPALSFRPFLWPRVLGIRPGFMVWVLVLFPSSCVRAFIVVLFLPPHSSPMSWAILPRFIQPTKHFLGPRP